MKQAYAAISSKIMGMTTNIHKRLKTEPSSEKEKEILGKKLMHRYVFKRQRNQPDFVKGGNTANETDLIYLKEV